MCRICWSAEVKTDVELASKITENAKVGVSKTTLQKQVFVMSVCLFVLSSS